MIKVNSNSISFIVLAFAVAMHLSCNSEQRTAWTLKGHWHTIPAAHYDITLDIDDSLVILNRYSLLEAYRQFPLFDSLNQSIALPMYCGCGDAVLPVIDKFIVSDDTLTYDDEILDECYAFKSLKFVKCDVEKCKSTHAISGGSYVVLVEFPAQTSTRIDFDSLQRHSKILSLMVGAPKNKTEWGVDSKIQMADMFVAQQEVTQVINEIEKSSVRPVSICLLVDTSVPVTFVEALQKQIPARLAGHTFRLVSLADGGLGYEKIGQSDTD